MNNKLFYLLIIFVCVWLIVEDLKNAPNGKVTTFVQRLIPVLKTK